MSSPGNRKVKDKAKSNDPTTEKIETNGQPYYDKSGRTPLNSCLKSQRAWLDKELVQTEFLNLSKISLLHSFQEYDQKL